MSFASTLAFQSFWSQSWSAPLRLACHWLTRDPAPVVPSIPEALAPDWLRPLCFQREVARAIRDRLAWLRAHPDQAAMLYNLDSLPCWSEVDWTPYGRGVLRSWKDERLLEHAQLEVERLLRIMLAPPRLLGEEDWTHAALGTCEHLAQLYRELRRRCGAHAVRVALRHLLTSYVCWVPEQDNEEEENETE
ncbi:MAG TPA: hypothetical protein VKT82_28495 [Ktedonobacterales bacterium]|nr:hypothetical protein [Ktedonobacterales bacterium]